jgi:hypothetical protein
MVLEKRARLVFSFHEIPAIVWLLHVPRIFPLALNREGLAPAPEVFFKALEVRLVYECVAGLTPRDTASA